MVEAGRLLDLAREVVFLGDFQGIAHVAVDLSPLDEEMVGTMTGTWGQFSDLREIGLLIERFEGAVMAYARADVLARPPRILRCLRQPHRQRQRRSPAQLHQPRLRRQPFSAHRPGGDHVGT